MEIIEVMKRCRICGIAEHVLVQDAYMTMGGDMVQAIYRDEIPHTKKDCDRMVTLEREQWPSLW